MNENIASAWKLADAIDHREGMIAYQRYRKTMQRFASRYEHSLAEVTAAFCALSPNNDYMGNLRSLLTLLEGKRNNVEPKDLTVSTYNACKFRAWRFLNGEDFLAVTKGPKTRSFYQIDPNQEEIFMAMCADCH